MMDNLNFLFPRSCIEGKPLNLKAYEFVIDFIWGIEIQIRMCKFLYFGQLSKFWQTLNEKGPRTRLLGSHFSRLWININNQLAFWLQVQFLTWIMFYCISYIYIINSIQLYFSTLSNWLLSWALNISIREGNEPLETLRTAQSAKLWRVSFKLNTNTQIQIHKYKYTVMKTSTQLKNKYKMRPVESSKLIWTSIQKLFYSIHIKTNIHWMFFEFFCHTENISR